MEITWLIKEESEFPTVCMWVIMRGMQPPLYTDHSAQSFAFPSAGCNDSFALGATSQSFEAWGEEYKQKTV